MLACEKAGSSRSASGRAPASARSTHLVAAHAARARSLDGEPPERAATRDRRDRAIGADELWFLNSTSGTTGLPKMRDAQPGALVRVPRVRGPTSRDFTADDVFLTALPAPFGFGLWTAHFTPAILGAPCVVCARFDARARARARSSATA